jgi:hypothetical protein
MRKVRHTVIGMREVCYVGFERVLQSEGATGWGRRENAHYV